MRRLTGLVVAGVVDGNVLPRDTTGSTEANWCRWSGLYQAPTADQAALLAEADHAGSDD
ncbi:hypothetical protein [Streptomyces sp. NPDC050848]|uniref:hypothetical protein n=1 Tax=Streptomyces sp. NPDC050848 TaxID=3155791 RepID=UPI0033D0928A